MVNKKNIHNLENHFYTILKKIPSEYRDDVATAWEAVKNSYSIHSHHMPQPVWKIRGYDETGKQSWEKIKVYLSEQSKSPAVSMYIHIPFCKAKCGFCDCLSVSIRDNTPIEQFINALKNEIKLWANVPGLKQRPVTVIYFGGGTPNSIPDHYFKQVIQKLTRGFSVNSDTQISVECTAQLLTPTRLNLLKSLHVNRISIGIQTLEEPLRFKLGRKSSTSEVLSLIHQCKQKEFTTCGDVIYGLPQQTITGFIDTVKKLIDAKIDGLSMYRFNVLQRNRQFINENFKHFKIDETLNYIFFQIGHQLLSRAGYKKNHFIHFAKNDSNMYYRHLLREEDLIAIGPTADGVVGSYRYRHPNIKGYLAKTNLTFPVLEGGIAETETALKIKPATVQLMCGGIDENIIKKLNIRNLIKKWEKCKILEKEDSDSYLISANGSWLIDQLMNELEKTFKAQFQDYNKN